MSEWLTIDSAPLDGTWVIGGGYFWGPNWHWELLHYVSPFEYRIDPKTGERYDCKSAWSDGKLQGMERMPMASHPTHWIPVSATMTIPDAPPYDASIDGRYMKHDLIR